MTGPSRRGMIRTVMLRGSAAICFCLMCALLLCEVPVARAITSCTITSLSNVRFGAYNSNHSLALDSTGLIALQCEGVQPSDRVQIQLSRGRSGSFQPRRMAGRGKALEYNLYLDGARTVIWGDGSSGTSTYTAAPSSGRTVNMPIYARIPPKQNVRPGVYGDLIVVTVNY